MKKESLDLGQVHIENVTQRTVSVIGRKGMGKSQTLKMLAYGAPLDLPCYVFDPLGKMQIEGFQRILITKEMASNEKALKQMPQVFNKVKDKKIIFSFQTMLQAEMVAFTEALFSAWAPKDCLIFVDEVQEITPEKGMGLEYSPEFERAVRHWRNENVGFVIATQRPAFTSKRVLGLTDYFILYAITIPQDTRVVKELLGDALQPDMVDGVMSKLQTKPFLNGYAVDFQ